MKPFARSDTSTPNIQGFNIIPEVGYINDSLTPDKVSPFGNCYQIGVYGIINQQATDINQVIAISTLGVETPLEIVYVQQLPYTLEFEKCYISNISGFGGTVYFASSYSNYSVKYKFALVATTITTDMFNVMLPVAKIFTKIIATEFSPYEKLCNGQSIDPNAYPIYNQEIRKIEALKDKLWFDDGTLKVPDYNLAVMLLSKTGMSIEDTPAGLENTVSYMPKAGFRTAYRNIDIVISNDSNAKKNDAAGRTGPRPNGGMRTVNLGIPPLSPNFNDFVANDPTKVKSIGDTLMPPSAAVYPFIVVR